MKAVLLLCLSAVALGLPQQDAKTLLDIREQPAADGSYSFNIETDNGITFTEEGAPGAEQQINAMGSFSFTDEQGRTYTVTYTSDENGFQATGDHLPVPPPAPAHVADLLRIADEQRLAGVSFSRK